MKELKKRVTIHGFRVSVALRQLFTNLSSRTTFVRFNVTET